MDTRFYSPYMTSQNHLIEVLALRHEILRSLLDAPKERRVLVDHLDDSKSTVYHGVSQLQEIGLIELTSDGLQPTQFGMVALERYDELARTADLRKLLVDLRPGVIEPAALVGAEVVTPDKTAVDRHLVRLETMLRNAESIRGFSPAVSPDYLSILHQRIVADELTAEFVLTERIVTALHQEHPSIAGDLISAPNATLSRTKEDVPFTLIIVTSASETEVGIELGEDGLATGLVINDAPACLQWAESIYERYQRTAERVTE